MTSGRSGRTVAIVGAGAAGTLVALQLCEAGARRRTPFDLVLIDPASEAGRGTAYATRDPRHRLNVPAGNMSCYPDDPGHFVRWLCHHGEPKVTAADFATRYRYGAYLADTLGRAIVTAQGTVGVRRLRTRVTGCRWTAPTRSASRATASCGCRRSSPGRRPGRRSTTPGVRSTPGAAGRGRGRCR